MKLTDLRPCSLCRKPLMQAPAVRPFFILRLSRAIVMPGKANEVLGLVHVLGGGRGSLAIAECLSPATDDAVKVWGDSGALFVCFDCATCGEAPGQISALIAVDEAEKDAGKGDELPGAIRS